MTRGAGLDLGPDAAALLDGLGAPVRRAELLTPLRSGATRRRSYRLDLADGRVVKLRRSSSADKARRYVELVRALADPRLAGILAHRGDATLEEWVPGAVLGEPVADAARIEAAAALLAGLHAARPAGGPAIPATVETGPARQRVERELRALADCGAIAREVAAELEAAARRDDPGVAASGVIHTDLCPENLVVDKGGDLRAIDNEAIRIGPIGFDLGRVWYRWPMAGGEWARFLAAYARRVDPAPALAHFAFWRIAAVAKSARLRVDQGAASADVPLRRLTSLAAEATGGPPADR